MSANSLHIGIAGSAFNPLCDIFHMLIVWWGKLTAARRTSWCSRSTQRIQSLYDHEFFIGFELGHDDCFFVTGAAAPAADCDDRPAVAQARVEGTRHFVRGARDLTLQGSSPKNSLIARFLPRLLTSPEGIPFCFSSWIKVDYLTHRAAGGPRRPSRVYWKTTTPAAQYPAPRRRPMPTGSPTSRR